MKTIIFVMHVLNVPRDVFMQYIEPYAGCVPLALASKACLLQFKCRNTCRTEDYVHSIPALEWAVSYGLPWNYATMNAVVAGGNRKCMEWARKQSFPCPITDSVFLYCSFSDLRWLFRQSIPVSMQTMIYLVRRASKDFFALMLTRIPKRNSLNLLAKEAMKQHRHDLLEIVLRRQPDACQYTSFHDCNYNDMLVIMRCVTTCCPNMLPVILATFPEDIARRCVREVERSHQGVPLLHRATKAAAAGHLDTLTWLVEEFEELESETFCSLLAASAADGAVRVVEWLIERYDPRWDVSFDVAAAGAAENGHLEVLQILYPYTTSWELALSAAFSVSSTALAWLVDAQVSYNVDELFAIALVNPSPDVWDYVTTRFPHPSLSAPIIAMRDTGLVWTDVQKRVESTTCRFVNMRSLFTIWPTADLAFFTWLLLRCFDVTYHERADIARHLAGWGRLDVLLLFDMDKDDWENVMYHGAAHQGIVKHAVETYGCEIREDVTCRIVESGSLTTLKWAVNHGAVLGVNCALAAAQIDRLDILVWLVGNGCPWDRTAVWTYAQPDTKAWMNLMNRKRKRGEFVHL